jgi:hypothetical protein
MLALVDLFAGTLALVVLVDLFAGALALIVLVVFFASALAVVLSSLLVVLGLQERVSLSLADGDGSCAGPEIQERPV